MARYKEYSYSQGKFIPIHFSKQILPGTFEYTLNYLIDNELDLSIFDKKYKNNDTGAPAYDPAILLKIILYGYSLGSVLSRQDGTGRTTFTERMKRKIDSAAGRALYAMQLTIGEPPFANIRSALRLDRFTLRGKRKLNIQWNLFCMIHNIRKIHRYGPGFA